MWPFKTNHNPPTPQVVWWITDGDTRQYKTELVEGRLLLRPYPHMQHETVFLLAPNGKFVGRADYYNWTFVNPDELANYPYLSTAAPATVSQNQQTK